MNHKLYRISFDIKGAGVTVSVVSDSFELAIKQAVLNCKDHVGDQFKDDVSEDCISGIVCEGVEVVMSNDGELKELVSEHGRLNEVASLREEVNRLLKEALELQERNKKQMLSIDQLTQAIAGRTEENESLLLEVERLKERNKILVTGSSQLRNEVSYLTKEIDALREGDVVIWRNLVEYDNDIAEYVLLKSEKEGVVEGWLDGSGWKQSAIPDHQDASIYPIKFAYMPGAGLAKKPTEAVDSGC
jgi:FtsZ-binding cell division protein ZapB